MGIELLWCGFDLNIDCNRNCEFCINREEANLRSELISPYFTPTMIQLAKAKINQLITKYSIKTVCIPILGGEPLLHPELPVQLTTTLKELPVPVDVWLYTNGDFLNDGIIKEYKEHRIWITLSAADTELKELIDKIDLLKHFFELPRLSITLSKENLDRLEKLVKLAIEKQFTIRFRNQYYPDKETIGLYGEIVPKAMELYLTAPFLSPKNMVYTYEDIWPSWTSEKSPYTCGRSHLHFGYDGHIRSCSGNAMSAYLGTIFDENSDPIAQLKSCIEYGLAGRWSAKTIEECRGCEVYSVCQGGCPLTRWHYYRDFNKPSPYCQTLKKVIPLFMARYHRGS